MKLSFVRVQTWEVASDLLRVRNECREGMTNNRELITEEQQGHFYEEEILPGETFECYVLYDAGAPIGYGIIKKESADRCWMTAGLTVDARSKGLSRILIALITQMGYSVAREVWIDVFDDNLALRGDIREGYELVNSTQRDGELLHLMRHKRDRFAGDWEAARVGAPIESCACECGARS